MTHEEEERAIKLADAAGRAVNNGLTVLADKLAAEADKLLAPLLRKHATFEVYAESEGLPIENRHDVVTDDYVYLSVTTNAMYKCWKAAGGGVQP